MGSARPGLQSCCPAGSSDALVGRDGLRPSADPGFRLRLDWTSGQAEAQEAVPGVGRVAEPAGSAHVARANVSSIYIIIIYYFFF